MNSRSIWMAVMTGTLALPSISLAQDTDDSPRIADADWHRTEWRASTFTRSAQAQASLAVDEAGQMVVVWSSRRQQDGQYGVYAQRFDARGVAIGEETCVNLWTNSHQVVPSVAVGPTPTADQTTTPTPWVVWQSHDQDGQAGSIIGRRFRGPADGQCDLSFNGSSEFLVNENWKGHQTDPAIAISNAGRAIVAWTSLASIDEPTRIQARLFDADGQPLGASFGTCDDDEIAQQISSAAFAADGSFAIAYAVTDFVTNAPAGVRFQRYDETGNPIGLPIRVNDPAGAHEVEPAIAATRDGFVVTWMGASNDAADWAVFSRRYDHEGNPLESPVVVSPASLGGHSGAAVAVAPDGRYAIAYNRADSDDTGIFGRLFAADGAPLGAEFQINRHRNGKQAMRIGAGTQRLAFTPGGALVCAWTGDAGCDDDSSVNVTMLSPRPVELAGAVQGVTAAMRPAGARTESPAMAPGEALALADEAPAPHEPPIFDPRDVSKGEREITLSPGGDVGFTAIQNTGWTPPDPHMAVGPEQVIVMTNGAIASFGKDGSLEWEDQIEGGVGFWGSLGTTGFVFDPEVLYDPMSEGFFAMASESTTQSRILIAVSTDSTPDEFSWHKYRFNTGGLAGGTYDSPNIAVDNTTVYISGDALGNYPFYVYDKASLLAGVNPVSTNSFNMSTTTQSAGIPPVSFDNPPALYMAEHKEATNNTTVRLIALRNALTSPVITNFTIPVPAYGRPEDPPQMGTSSRPNTFDGRFWSVAYRNGSLWATHHINSDRVLARWYEFAMNGWPSSGDTPTLVQTGEIDPGTGIRTFFSSITVDPFGNAAICYSRSSPNEFISMATSFRYKSDPLGTFQPSIIRRSANAGYTAGRWGDYSAMEVDPVDNKTMWAHAEWAQGSAWSTWVQGFTPVYSASDVNCDGKVNFTDLLLLLANWGPCAGCGEDIDDNGFVEFTDLLLLLAGWDP